MNRGGEPDGTMKRRPKADRLYAEPLERVPNFEFDAAVVEVFEDMIQRSVPFYDHIAWSMAGWARRFSVAETNLYDLGCSTGIGTAALLAGAVDRTRVIGVDNSPAMIDEARSKLSSVPEHDVRLELRCEDLFETDIRDASMTVLNYTLQFIAPERRLDLLRRIFAATVPGGAVLLSEKVHVDDDREQDLLTRLHHDFKRMRGYSELEITQKRLALEKTLITETESVHRERLASAGFSTVVRVNESLGFASWIAVKGGVSATSTGDRPRVHPSP